MSLLQNAMNDQPYGVIDIRTALNSEKDKIQPKKSNWWKDVKEIFKSYAQHREP